MVKKAKNKKKAPPVEKTIRKTDDEDLFGPDLPLPFRKKLFLEITPESGKSKTFEFAKGRIVLGRKDADVILDDPEVSKKHAVIEAFSRDNIYIRDLASTNGTFVNEVQVNNRKLGEQDTIRIGSTRLKFYTQDSEE